MAIIFLGETVLKMVMLSGNQWGLINDLWVVRIDKQGNIRWKKNAWVAQK
jgi:hypothetical protein